jgi:ubiquinone/menaquinone biosynthesis C-methylase UbiE
VTPPGRVRWLPGVGPHGSPLLTFSWFLRDPTVVRVDNHSEMGIDMQGHSQRHKHRRKSSRSVINGEFFMEEWGPGEGESMLDLGCGDGYLSIAAAKQIGAKGIVYAMDIDREWLTESEAAAADQAIDNVRWVCGDATKEIPLERHCVDYVLMTNVLHGFVANRELSAVMQEVNRVLKPGGKLVVVEFKKAAMEFGPPVDIRLKPDEVASTLGPFGYSLAHTAMCAVYHHQTTLRRLPPIGNGC